MLQPFHVLLWIAYLVMFPFGKYTTIIGVLANAIGMIRRCGIPALTLAGAQQFLQGVAFCDEFHNLTYLMATSMSGGNLFVAGPIIISAALFLAVELKKTFAHKLPGFIKKWVEKGAQNDI